ncbi:hypothetical protein [Pseudomonas chlororaphis]|uniref:hypothetical protein n=1 Tax=Pseudomonas chlororaphis TaxID=587753 RepID=UPI0039E123CB
MIDLDLKKLTAYLRRNLVGILVVYTLYAGIGLKLWDVHKDQEAEKKSLSQERIVINDLKVAFEKEKASLTVDQATRDLELQKREFLVGRAEGDLAKQKLEVANREQLLLDSTQQLKNGQQLLSKEQQVADAEEKIQRMMSEFSELGVNLSDNHHCLSGEPLKRFYSARAKFSQIYTLIKANLLFQKYGDFIEQNKPQGSWFSC